MFDVEIIPSHVCSKKRPVRLFGEVDLKTFSYYLPTAWANTPLMEKYPCIESLVWANQVFVGRSKGPFGISHADGIEAVAVDGFATLLLTFLLAHSADKGTDILMELYHAAKQGIIEKGRVFLPRHIYAIYWHRVDDQPSTVKVHIEYDSNYLDFKDSTRVPVINGWVDNLFIDTDE